MTRINAVGANIKAAETADQTDTRAKIDEARAQIAKERAEHASIYTDEQLAEMDRIDAMLQAEAAVIDGDGATGDSPDEIEKNQTLDPLWNNIPSSSMTQTQEDAAFINSDPAKYGEYAQTISIPNSGNPLSPTEGAFQMTDDMNSLKAETHGRDIILTAGYADGSRKSWVIKNGAVNGAPIILSALGLTHGVTIDSSKVYRTEINQKVINDKIPSGFYIWGSEHDDVLIGSQSDDKIIGMAGADKLDGQAGKDIIWGDEQYDIAGSFNSNYGGDDTIRGGAGKDQIYGGGGTDTTFVSDHGEIINEEENPDVKDTTATATPDAEDFITTSNDWEVSSEEGDNTIVIKNTTGKGGNINVDMPDGYNMAYANKDPDGSLLITFVGPNGEFKVKIEDFFHNFTGDTPNEGIVHFNFNGGAGDDIIDFSRIDDLENQVINLNGGDGSDMILGPRNKMLDDGVDLSNLTSSQGNSTGVLKSYVEQNSGIFGQSANAKDDDNNVATYGGYLASVDGNHIVISKDPAKADKDPTLSIAAPEGYDNAYITEKDGETYVILVKPSTTGGTADTIAIKIDKALELKPSDIVITQKTASGSRPIDLISISSNIDENGNPDYNIDGGSKSDLIFAQEGFNVIDDENEDDVVTITKSKTTSSRSKTPETGSTGSGTQTAGGTGTGS